MSIHNNLEEKRKKNIIKRWKKISERKHYPKLLSLANVHLPLSMFLRFEDNACMGYVRISKSWILDLGGKRLVVREWTRASLQCC
jgi:hypothetical protein